MLYRGTTPYHNFILPVKAEDISMVYITYMQGGEILFEFGKEEIQLTNIADLIENGFITDENWGDDLSGNDANPEEEVENFCQATVHLTQEQTLLFKFYPAAEKNIAGIQIRVLTNDGEAYASEAIRERIYGVIKDGII